ncbi:substrate-binding periplasmic protein [Chitinimonas naiadis]
MRLQLLRLAIATTLLFSFSTAWALDKPGKVRICSEDEDSYPWVLKDKPGLNVIMMRLVEKQLGTTVEVQPLPWKRCMALVKAGELDGLFKISFAPDRLETGRYPMVGDRPDASKRMLDESYSLYRLKGSKVEWDGTAIRNAPEPIGAQPGYSIIPQLKGMGMRVDDGVRGAAEHFQKLLVGRVSAVALQTLQGDASLAQRPEFVAKIERIDPPLVTKPYFLMLSKPFVEKYPDFAQKVWETVAVVRESGEYKTAMQQFK